MGSEILESHPGGPGGPRGGGVRERPDGPPVEQVLLLGSAAAGTRGDETTGGEPLDEVLPAPAPGRSLGQEDGERPGTALRVRLRAARPYAVTAVVAALVAGAVVQARAEESASREAAAAFAVSASGDVGLTRYGFSEEPRVVVDVSVENLGPRAVELGGPVQDGDAALRVVASSALRGRLAAGERRAGSVTLAFACDRSLDGPPRTAPVRLQVVTGDGVRHVRAVSVDGAALRRHVADRCDIRSALLLESTVVEGGRAVDVTYTPRPGAPSPGSLTVAGVPGVEVVTDHDLPLDLRDEVVTLRVRPVVSSCEEVAAHPEMLSQVGQLSVTDLGEWGVPDGMATVVGAAVARACPA